MLPEAGREYLLQGLAATPVVVDRLLRDATPEGYDRRPDPERFTLREALCHLAEWEEVWQGRFRALCEEAHPTLPNRDPDEAAERNDYAHAEVASQLERFREGRRQLVMQLRELSPEQWQRTGTHAKWGDLTVEALATLVLGHDGYHLRQIVEWLDA